MPRCAFPPAACLLIVCSAVAAACGGSDGAYVTSGRNALTGPSSAAPNTADGSGRPAPTPAPALPRGDAFGAVSKLSGSCPTITFAVGNKTVATNTSTTFKRGACTDVANGVDVAARGTVRADGSILANAVDVRPQVTTFGTITQLGGTCPSLTFSVGTQVVSTNASTMFDGTACASLDDGNHVGIVGVTQPNGTILATRVESHR